MHVNYYISYSTLGKGDALNEININKRVVYQHTTHLTVRNSYTELTVSLFDLFFLYMLLVLGQI